MQCRSFSSAGRKEGFARCYTGIDGSVVRVLALRHIKGFSVLLTAVAKVHTLGHSECSFICISMNPDTL